MDRTIFDEEHEMFRKAFRTFVEREMVPHRDEWDRAGLVDKDLFAKAGAAGFIAMDVPEYLRRGGGQGLPVQPGRHRGADPG